MLILFLKTSAKEFYRMSLPVINLLDWWFISSLVTNMLFFLKHLSNRFLGCLVLLEVNFSSVRKLLILFWILETPDKGVARISLPIINFLEWQFISFLVWELLISFLEKTFFSCPISCFSRVTFTCWLHTSSELF